MLQLASQSVQSNHGKMVAPSLNDIVRCRRPRSVHVAVQLHVAVQCMLQYSTAACACYSCMFCRRSSQRPNADRPNDPTGGP
eukprot:9486303-Alexandrium_andersonii.AAC.1